jgi:hypothetical protein
MNRLIGIVAASLLLSLSACGVAEDSAAVPQPLTWEQFRAQATVEPETNVFIINGDELAETEDDLRRVYDAYLADFKVLDPNATVATKRDALIVNTVDGADDRWPQATASNLTYCISQKDFGANYQAVVNAMNSAAGAWEASGNVNFVHVSSLDGNCTNRSNVVFDVRSVCRGQYLARAFFPSTSRRSREVLIDCTSFGNISPWTLTGVLRHELGHTLGFRHEHTRPESGTCFENNSWRALTAYDSSSVMHYPQCNGTQTGDLVLTNLDKQGAASLYP